MANGYYFLGKDWLETAKKWKKSKQPTPPVMITVANTTYTAARVGFSFEHKKINIEELCDPEGILHIDSRVLDQAEEQEEPVQLDLSTAAPEEEGSEEGEEESNGPRRKLSKKEQAELLRLQVDTVGRVGDAGRKNSKCDFGGNALGRLGRQDGDAHHGSACLHFTASLRAGSWARTSPNLI